MEKYVALLRGINVGGKNRVPMAELKLALEDYGFTSVRTYINSGNVIFSSSIKELSKITKILQTIILEKFELNIPVLVISSKEFKKIEEDIPLWWGTSGKEIHHDAIFVIPPMTTEKILLEIGEGDKEYENIAISETLIFWSVDLKKYSKSKWAKMASTPLYSKVTVRNANTTKKLLKLIED